MNDVYITFLRNLFWHISKEQTTLLPILEEHVSNLPEHSETFLLAGNILKDVWQLLTFLTLMFLKVNVLCVK